MAYQHENIHLITELGLPGDHAEPLWAWIEQEYQEGGGIPLGIPRHNHLAREPMLSASQLCLLTARSAVEEAYFFCHPDQIPMELTLRHTPLRSSH
jgi:hypothetical protein